MDIQEIANSYAEGKANEAITKAIAQAYIDGYKDGYKSGKENAQIEYNDAEFVDLGLPSGTLWASDYLKDTEGKVRYLPYMEAKEHSLPSIEQWKELEQYCRWDASLLSDKSKIFHCVGLNGNVISFSQTGFIESCSCVVLNEVKMWLKDDSENLRKQSVWMCSERRFPEVSKSTSLMFCGFKLPIRLVR